MHFHEKYLLFIFFDESCFGLNEIIDGFYPLKILRYVFKVAINNDVSFASLETPKGEEGPEKFIAMKTGILQLKIYF